jgi:hypothetical protein
MQAIVNILGDEGFPAHRGVIYLRGGDFLVFGNDGYNQDERTKREVESVRRLLAPRAAETGFALTEDGYSWALLIRCRENYATEAGRETCRNLLTLALWQGYSGKKQSAVGDGFEAWQSKESEQVIATLRPKLLALLD